MSQQRKLPWVEWHCWNFRSAVSLSLVAVLALRKFNSIPAQYLWDGSLTSLPNYPITSAIAKCPLGIKIILPENHQDSMVEEIISELRKHLSVQS